MENVEIEKSNFGEQLKKTFKTVNYPSGNS